MNKNYLSRKNLPLLQELKERYEKTNSKVKENIETEKFSKDKNNDKEIAKSQNIEKHKNNINNGYPKKKNNEQIPTDNNQPKKD